MASVLLPRLHHVPELSGGQKSVIRMAGSHAMQQCRCCLHGICRSTPFRRMRRDDCLLIETGIQIVAEGRSRLPDRETKEPGNALPACLPPLPFRPCLTFSVGWR